MQIETIQRKEYKKKYYQEHKDKWTNVYYPKRKLDTQHKEKRNAAVKKWYSDPEKRARRNEYCRQWEKDNPRRRDFIEMAYHGLLMKKKGNPCATRGELKQIWEEQNGKCGLTGVLIPEGVKPHLDHKIPQSKGGVHTIDNLRWVHPMSNMAKRNNTDEEFLTWWNSR